MISDSGKNEKKIVVAVVGCCFFFVTGIVADMGFTGVCLLPQYDDTWHLIVEDR